MSIQDKINRILWDRRIIILPDDFSRPEDLEYVILKDPTLADRNYYLTIKDIEISRAKKDGVPTEAENFANAKINGYWGKQEEDIEANADKHIEFLEAEFEAKKKFKSRQNIIKLQIEDAKAKKQYVQRKKNELHIASAEYLAHEIACIKLLQKLVLYPDGRPLLTDNTILLFKNEYHDLLYFLINQMLDETALEIKEIREIARSIDWRLTWTLSKENLQAIFNRPICDFNMNHKMLIYWSRVYDSAFESTEPPSSDIIDDDEKFDEWLANKDNNHKQKSTSSGYQEQGRFVDGEYIESCTCGAKQKNAKRSLGERIPHDSGCQFGVWHKFTDQEKQEKAKQIYGKNSSRIRQLIDDEQENITKRGFVEEEKLRSKKSREVLGLKTNITPMKNR